MKCPKCGYQPKPKKPGRPRSVDRGQVLALSKQGYSLRAIAKVLGVTHGAIAQILKGSTMKAVIAFILLTLNVGCASTKYAWKPAPEKDVAQTQADLTKCQRASYLVPVGHFGNEQEKFFYKCMYSLGHTLVEEQE